MELAEKFAANISNTKGCIRNEIREELKKIIILKNNYENN